MQESTCFIGQSWNYGTKMDSRTWFKDVLTSQGFSGYFSQLQNWICCKGFGVINFRIFQAAELLQFSKEEWKRWQIDANCPWTRPYYWKWDSQSPKKNFWGSANNVCLLFLFEQKQVSDRIIPFSRGWTFINGHVFLTLGCFVGLFS